MTRQYEVTGLTRVFTSKREAFRQAKNLARAAQAGVMVYELEPERPLDGTLLPSLEELVTRVAAPAGDLLPGYTLPSQSESDDERERRTR